MTRYLFRFSYGPVQPFIAASRRTRDLANGSRLLVRLGQWIAAEAKERGENIVWIFPHEPQAEAANVLQFVAESEDPRALAAACRSAAVRRFREEYERANLPQADLAEHQFDAYLQFFAAWEPLSDDAEYRDANQRVASKLATRKLLRAFGPAPSSPGYKDGTRVHYPPKSPLLPALDCVLPLRDLAVPQDVQERYLVDAYEFLDGISLLKRRMKGDGPFPSTLTICALGAVSQLEDDGTMTRFQELVREAFRNDWGADPGELLFQDETDPEAQQPRHSVPPELREEVNALKTRLQERGIGRRAYYAVLHADGDSMGKRLSELTTLEEHHRFSKELAEKFAKKVPGIVQSYHGCCVYAGGDDVLALLPAQTALLCGKELNRLFCSEIEGCTLSVGVAIVHAHHSLQHAIGLSRELERMAKDQPGKNAIAVGVFPRNGGETRICFPFNGPQNSPISLDSFLEHAQRWKDGVPRSLPYDLRDEAKRLPATALPWVVPGAYRRIVQRKRLEGEHAEVPPEWVNTSEQLLRYADHLAVAHFLTRGGKS